MTNSKKFVLKKSSNRMGYKLPEMKLISTTISQS